MDPMNHSKPQPSRRQLPRGLEVLINKAAVDPEFRALLLERRAEAVRAIGLDLILTPTETAMLAAIPREQLEAIIANTKVPSKYRHIFLGTAAAAMLAVVGLAGLALNCEQTYTYGNMPDRPPSLMDRLEGLFDKPDLEPRWQSAGISPDRIRVGVKVAPQADLKAMRLTDESAPTTHAQPMASPATTTEPVLPITRNDEWSKLNEEQKKHILKNIELQSLGIRPDRPRRKTPETSTTAPATSLPDHRRAPREN